MASHERPSVGRGRSFVTRRYLDKQLSPPDYVAEELPTRTIKLRGPARRGVSRAPAGTILGSYRITGSWREASAPGTYSARITRLSVFAGSPETRWFVRHSREGTTDIIYFPQAGHETRLGGPKNPIYSWGPGTVIYGFLPDGTNIGSAHWLGQFMEGITG